MSILDIIAGRESGGASNPLTVVNPIVTSSGNAGGLYQITSGTWADFAGRAGVNLGQYPTAQSAPADVQTAVAGVIPLSRWAPSTVDAVERAYGGTLDPAQPIGALAASVGEGGNLGGSGDTLGSAGGAFSYTDPRTWLPALADTAGPYLERGALVVLAIVLLLGGVWLFASRSQIVQQAGAA